MQCQARIRRRHEASQIVLFKAVPQGLKAPRRFARVCGTTKVMPFHNDTEIMPFEAEIVPFKTIAVADS